MCIWNMFFKTNGMRGNIFHTLKLRHLKTRSILFNLLCINRSFCNAINNKMVKTEETAETKRAAAQFDFRVNTKSVYQVAF